MAQPAKYLFDQDFGSGATGKPAITLAEHTVKLGEAETAAYARGYAAAERDAEGRAAASLERIAAAIETFHRSLAAIEAKFETDAVEVAVAVARKLAGELVAREPLAEITALTAECLRHLVEAPHVVVRVNDQLQDRATRALEEIVRTRGFTGRLIVMAEPGIAAGDCRIEWADGGINRDAKAAEAAIADTVSRYVTARRKTATAGTLRSPTL
jgi:flagellar assembly protein FliH